jgi:hypothetical protein
MNAILTPYPHAPNLLLSRIEHGCDNQEPGADRALKETKQKSADEQAGKILACGMAKKGYRPEKDAHALRI